MSKFSKGHNSGIPYIKWHFLQQFSLAGNSAIFRRGGGVLLSENCIVTFPGGGILVAGKHSRFFGGGGQLVYDRELGFTQL